MTAKFSDDWGTALGSDKDVYTPPPTSKKKPKKDTLSGLVYDFRDVLMMDTSNLMNAQVNGPAMMKAFRNILDSGRTYEDIRAMMKQFAVDIKAKPLADGIPAWKAFLGRLDTLEKKVAHSEPSYDYTPNKVDPRLVNDND